MATPGLGNRLTPRTSAPGNPAPRARCPRSAPIPTARCTARRPKPQSPAVVIGLIGPFEYAPRNRHLSWANVPRRERFRLRGSGAAGFTSEKEGLLPLAPAATTGNEDWGMGWMSAWNSVGWSPPRGRRIRRAGLKRKTTSERGSGSDAHPIGVALGL